MLQNLREKFTGWVAITILAVIGVTFVFVGGANFTFVGNNYAAKVDDAEVGLGQFEAAYRDQMVQNPQLSQVSDEVRLQIRSTILEQLIEQRVIDNYLEDAGIQISNEQVTAIIQRTPEFQVDGRFDMETYRNLLAQNGYEPATFERAQRVNLRRQQLHRAVRGSAVMTPAAYRRYLNLATEQRIVTLATIDAETVAADVEVTDEMIAAYYDNNPTLFQLPETVDLEYIEIHRNDIARSIEVSEEDLIEYYEINSDRYLQDEQRQARHILVQFGDDEAAAEAKANELLARINAGEAFEDIARDNSDDGGTASRGGDLGLLPQSALPGDFGGTIFSMAEGAIEGPVKTEFGFHIIRLDQVNEPGALPLEQVRAELTIELQEQMAENEFRALESQLSSALFDATDIAALAAEIGAEVETVAGFTRQGGEPFADSPAVVDAVFDEAMVSGEQISDIVEIDFNRSAVFLVTQHTPATRQPLADIRDQVADSLMTQQAENLMSSKADEMLAALADGTDFADAAAAIGATAAEPTLMSRNAEGADQFILVSVFTAVKPTQENPTTGSTRNAAGGYTVFSLDAVIPGRPEVLPQEQRDAGKLQLTDQTGMGEFVAFVKALRENAEIIINDDVLAQSDLL
jgi:peptidyl-prolyl cis-trans isomerase D